MAGSVSLIGAATVFVVQDVLRSVEHYRDVLGFQVEFTYGAPTFYAGVERGGVLIHFRAAPRPPPRSRSRSSRAATGCRPTMPRGTRSGSWSAAAASWAG